MLWQIVLVTAFLAVAALAGATDYYVGSGGNDGNGGLTPADAKLTLAGVAAIPLSAGDWVWVKNDKTYSTQDAATGAIFQKIRQWPLG